MLSRAQVSAPLLPDELFDPASIAPETEALNDALRQLPGLPHDIHKIRELMAQAAAEASPSGAPYESIRARLVEASPGRLPLRVIEPDGITPGRGVYIHAHGGGWSFGAASDNDAVLETLADATGFTVASVDYRLAPEFPFPTPLDDCEASIRFALDGGLGVSGPVVVGGESAGANLVLSAVLRMRDAMLRLPAGMVLYCGAYDLTATPSHRSFGTGLGVVDSESLAYFCRLYAGDADLADPALSPLYAELTNLPPALVLVGTKDPLLDDSLFLWARLRAARAAVRLHIAPGGPHGFNYFPIPIAHDAVAAHEEFLEELCALHC